MHKRAGGGVLSIEPVMNSSRADEPWQRCYAQLAGKLVLFARQWLPTPADAEDAVQTAFVKFWQRHPTAGPKHYPLLYAAVRTTALDALRRRARRARREEACATAAGLEAAQMFELPLEQFEETQRIESALRRFHSVVFDADSSPLRQVRYNYLERHAWTNRATGSRLEVELPREDTYLISVSIQ